MGSEKNMAKVQKKYAKPYFFFCTYIFFLTPWAGQARLAGQANLAALAPAGPIWSPTAGGLARQALLQYGGRRLYGKRYPNMGAEGCTASATVIQARP